MSSNKGIFPDNNGNSSDWVEIYNHTGHNIDLTNCAFTDDGTKPQKWLFPSVLLKPKGYIVIFMSGASSFDNTEDIVHCPFKLSSKGEKLLLTAAPAR